jgi:uncharacterized protein with HEPN domain
MPRSSRVYLEDILQACARVHAYVGGRAFDDFSRDSMAVDAVVRNLEIIGEAVKGIPDDVRSSHSAIEWRRLVGLRNILIHAYFAVDIEILWDIVVNQVPPLETEVQGILRESEP